MPEMLRIENYRGEPINFRGTTLTPFAQTISLRIPGFIGGFTWKRPLSVLARSADGQERIIPIQDVTRQVQIGLLLAALGATLLMWLVSRLFRKS